MSSFTTLYTRMHRKTFRNPFSLDATSLCYVGTACPRLTYLTNTTSSQWATSRRRWRCRSARKAKTDLRVVGPDLTSIRLHYNSSVSVGLSEHLALDVSGILPLVRTLRKRIHELFCTRASVQLSNIVRRSGIAITLL